MKKYQLKELGKLIEYILFHRPDEFGLFLDDDDSDYICVQKDGEFMPGFFGHGDPWVTRREIDRC